MAMEIRRAAGANAEQVVGVVIDKNCVWKYTRNGIEKEPREMVWAASTLINFHPCRHRASPV